jgi:hypothetical protein
MTTDAASLLRALRPASDFTPDEAALERILLAPPLAARGRRRRRRRGLALAGAVGLAAAAVALAPSSSPDVVARAAAALNDPDTILHLKSVDAGGNTMETWQADGGRKERWLYRGGTDKAVESMDDWDTKTALSYSAQNDELITHTEPDWFNEKTHPIRGLADGGPSNHVIDDLALLLDRARAGEGNVHLIGETTVRDIPVYELRIDYSIEVIDLPASGEIGDPTGMPTHTEQMHRNVYIRRDNYLPVRIVEHIPAPNTPAGAIEPVTDYVTAERLPRTPATEQLLKMSPHPGAKQVTEGRL